MIRVGRYNDESRYREKAPLRFVADADVYRFNCECPSLLLHTASPSWFYDADTNVFTCTLLRPLRGG